MDSLTMKKLNNQLQFLEDKLIGAEEGVTFWKKRLGLYTDQYNKALENRRNIQDQIAEVEDQIAKDSSSK